MATKKYADALDQQRKMNGIMKSNFGTMTHTEKRLNKEGLHHYKQGDPHEIKYMIPGLADNSQGIGGTMPIRGKGHQDRGRNKS